MKGISPLIAGVLLIAFTMAVAAFIGVFGTSFSKAETEKITTSSQCVGALQIDPLSVRFSQITRRVTGRITNYGKGTLDNFLVTVYYSNGESITRNITDNITAGSSISLSIHTGNNKNPEKISVFAENCGPSYSASLKISSDKIITGRYDYTMDPNLVAAWSLDEASGSRAAIWGTCGSDCDLSDTNGVGQDTVNYMEGVAAADFNEINDEYLNCTNIDCDELFPTPSSITYGCWGLRSSNTGDSVPLDQPTAIWTFDWNAQTGYALMGRADTFISECWIGYGGDRTTDYSSTGSFPIDDSFHHLACVYDNSVSSIENFIDGEGSGSPENLPSPMVHSGMDFRIGTASSTPKRWDGQLDECFVFNRALKSEEICEICRFGLDGTHADRGAQCSNCGYV